MSTQVKRRRGTQAENDAFTGAEGEIVVLTDEKRLAVHDASKQGGYEIPNDRDILLGEYTYALAGGTANALTASFVAAPATGASITLKISATNTGAATLAVNGGSAIAINKTDSLTGSLVALEANDLIIGAIYKFSYTGTVWQIVGGGGSSVEAASTAEIAAESAVDKYVRPDRMKYHPGIAKAWATFTYSGGTPTLNDSHNVSSVSTVSSKPRITFTTAMPDTNYAVIPVSSDVGATSTPRVHLVEPTTTYFDIPSGIISNARYSVVVHSTW